MPLILTRKPGESIAIGENVLVTVDRIEGGRCRLAVDAPDFVSIVRSELLETIREDNARKSLAIEQRFEYQRTA